MKLTAVIFLLFFFKASVGQGKVYFFNQTGRPVCIQKRNILEIGSYPYTLDTPVGKIQNISIDSESPTILNVSVIPKKGPYGTADGIHYLFKPNDTLIVTLNNSMQPIITHISSSIRTKELSFGLAILNYAGVTPAYTLVKTNPRLYSLFRSSQLKLRDKLIDSLSIPYIACAESFCKKESIDPQIGKLYQSHYRGMMITDKLLVGYELDSALRTRLEQYYQDSLIKWTSEMNCEDCQNIPFYNLALKEIYKGQYGNLEEHLYLQTVSSLTHGYSKNFLLSSYVVDRLEVSRNTTLLLHRYDSLCKDLLYNQFVHNNYRVQQNSSRLDDSELAMLMKGDQSKIGFTRLISSLKGKIIYIDFWASWCKPCIEEIPFSHLLREKIKDSNIVMLYISLDTDFNNWKESATRLNINEKSSYILTGNGKSKLAQKIKLGPIPRYIIVDKAGKIVNLDASRPSDNKTYSTLLQHAKN